ncbi:MAG: ABC transporter permease [Fibrobacteres bacterium]|nr:ABC transporter permease [Fibrobacterota bacterium]
MNGFFGSVFLGVVSAFREIRSQPLRALLSMTGVALAVAALAALLSFVAGLQAVVKESVTDMGGLGRVGVQTQEPTGALEARTFSRSPGLRASDGDTIESLLAGEVTQLRTAGKWQRITYLGEPTRAFLMGCDRDYLVKDVQAMMQDGAMPSVADFESGAQVALVAGTLADQWNAKAASKGESLVGSRVAIGGVMFDVVGTFKYRRSSWGKNAVTVAIPWKTWQHHFQGSEGSVASLQLRLEEADSVPQGISRLKTVLLGEHRGAEDFTFQQFDFLEKFSSMVGNISLLLGIVAGLSLSVGALGIFNTMLAGLNERIREIGVRKALGARPFQIGVQFLAESVALCTLGGLAGMGIGAIPAIFGQELKELISVKPEFTLAPVIGAMSLSVLVGILAGLWPALRAAKLSTVEALRYE